MSDFTVKALDESTWPDFARLVEKHADSTMKQYDVALANLVK